MICMGCYKKNVEGYCLTCRKKLFNGARVSHVLPFEEPKADNLTAYQEKTKRLSISGVQLKYSLRLEKKELVLTDKGGQYILKPVPPSSQITETSHAPENEHLTMQIAEQLYDIDAAANALIYFKDGAPAYVTRRFDVRPDGTKCLQEDFAQISGKSRQKHGENFKYDGSTYEDIGFLIRQHVPAYMPAIENYFRLIVFNYLISNGDAHLKNFSLIQTSMGDYSLSPAYDLMCTALHMPSESDSALDLYPGDIDSEFYKKQGYFGQPDFRALADKLGLLPKRAARIITHLLSGKEKVIRMVQESFLSDEAKRKYAGAYQEKLKRMGMTKDMIANIIDPVQHEVYATTHAPTKLIFRDGSFKTGHFENNRRTKELEEQNKFTFVESANEEAFEKTKEDKLIISIEGDELIDVVYPCDAEDDDKKS